MTFAERWNDLALLVPHMVALLFAFAFGACTGSFVNVVAWRMPLGMSIVSPPSRCPTCGYRLRWRDNLPIFGYLVLRGKCAACGIRIPPHYLLIELAMGLMFAAAYAVLFMPGFENYWYPVGHGWWTAQGLARAWPALVVVLFALSSMAAMTMADARTFHIPVAIPAWAIGVAFCGWLVESFTAGAVRYAWPISVPNWPLLLLGIFGSFGVLVSGLLLRIGVLRESFTDYHEYVKDGEVFADYPHTRREMGKELAFLIGPVAFAALGYFVGPQVWHAPAGGSAQAPLWIQALGACGFGFFIGGLTIWVVRIAASFLFDTEALGLGDVHLMAAVGAAFGWRSAAVGFVVAPFVGLAWWLTRVLWHAPMRVPFGPSLAIGGCAAFFLWPVIADAYFGIRYGMTLMADLARNHPGAAVGAGLVALCGSVALAAVAGRAAKGVGLAVAGSLLLVVASIMAWIFGSGGNVAVTISGGVLLLAGTATSSVLARAGQEEDAGPRTVLSRIMRLLVLVVALLGTLLVLIK